MRRSLVWAAAAALAAACALPKVEIDPSLAPDGGTSGGTGGKSGMGGSGGSGGTGDTTSQNGGETGSEARELECGDYCSTYLQACADQQTNTYSDADDCLTVCFTSDWPFGKDESEVNSLQCRDVHAHLAVDLKLPIPHCLHSAEFPTGTFCAPPP